MKTHWTERSVKDYLFRIATDFIAQLEKKMELQNITQDKLAERLGITKGRVSQLFNHPGNITLGNVVKFARTLGMKVSIVAYEDDDMENKKGPINSEIFTICWEKLKKPRDFWVIQEIDRRIETAFNKIGDESFFPPELLLRSEVSYNDQPYYILDNSKRHLRNLKWSPKELVGVSKIQKNNPIYLGFNLDRFPKISFDTISGGSNILNASNLH